MAACSRSLLPSPQSSETAAGIAERSGPENRTDTATSLRSKGEIGAELPSKNLRGKSEAPQAGWGATHSESSCSLTSDCHGRRDPRRARHHARRHLHGRRVRLRNHRVRHRRRRALPGDALH